MSSSEDHAPHLSETDARQGRWGRPVFWMLTISLSLAVLAMLGAWLWRADQLSAVQGAESAPASQVARFSTPPPEPKWTPRPPSPAG